MARAASGFYLGIFLTEAAGITANGGELTAGPIDLKPLKLHGRGSAALVGLNRQHTHTTNTQIGFFNFFDKVDIVCHKNLQVAQLGFENTTQGF